jgi:hypothetical protein
MIKQVDSIQNALHFDFCPWANKYVYWLKKPIGWVVLALLASLLLGIYVSEQAFLASAAIVAIGIIGCVWPWIAMQGIRGEIRWQPIRCEEDEEISAMLRLTNRWPWPSFGLFVEADQAIASSTAAPDQPICLSRVAGMAESEFEWLCKPGRRGIYPKQKIRLATAFPFGVWTCHRDLEVHSALVVWPRTTRLIDVPVAQGAPNSGIGSTSDQIGDEGDWMGVRPYRPGDSLKQVHWAQTARRDSLVVFERQAKSKQEVAIHFDEPAFASLSQSSVDDAIRILASICGHFLSHSWTVRVQLGTISQLLYAGHSSKQNWMDLLAQWEPGIANSLHTTQPNKPSHNGSTKPLQSSTNASLHVVISTEEHFPKLGCFDSLRILYRAPESAPIDEQCGYEGMQILIDGHNNVSEQLEWKWKQICQNASLQSSRVGWTSRQSPIAAVASEV